MALAPNSWFSSDPRRSHKDGAVAVFDLAAQQGGQLSSVRGGHGVGAVDTHMGQEKSSIFIMAELASRVISSKRPAWIRLSLTIQSPPQARILS